MEKAGNLLGSDKLASVGRDKREQSGGYGGGDDDNTGSSNY